MAESNNPMSPTVIGSSSALDRQHSYEAKTFAAKQQQQQQEGSSGALREKKTPVWIDSVTKAHIKDFMQESTIYAATSVNNPSVGLYHVQAHMKTRVPKIVDVGRSIGTTTTKHHKGLKKDTQFGAETCESISKITAFNSIARRISDGVGKIRRENEFLPTQSEALAAQKPQKKKGFFS